MQRIPVPIAAQQLGTSVSTLYATPAGVTTTVGSLSFNNTSGSPVSVTLFNVPSGSTPGAANQVITSFSIAAGRSYLASHMTGVNLGPGASLEAQASAAGAIVAQGGVYETSGS